MRCQGTAEKLSLPCVMTSKLGEVLSFLRTQLEKGRQLYVIYPLIDESDKLDVKAAAAEYELWRERLHPFRLRVASWPDSGAGKAANHGTVSARRDERVDQHDCARGRRRCAECNHDAD